CHAHVGRCAQLLRTIGPRLLALGINGMLPYARGGGGRVHPNGHGTRDEGHARIIVESGWHDPVRALGHTMDDVEQRLRDNLKGVVWLRARLELLGPDVLARRSRRRPASRTPFGRTEAGRRTQ